MVKTFFDLDVWQRAHRQVLLIYHLTQDPLFRYEKFGLVSQLRRSSTSVAANIAEGFGRYRFKDKIRFFHQARGSVTETQYHLVVCRDLKLVNSLTFETIFSNYDKTAKGLNALISSLKHIEN